MITAKEARELSSRMPIDAENDLRKIEAEIKIHASQGDHSFWHYGDVHKKAMEELKRLGYQLESFDSQREGFELKVSW